jgi:hypothetical protein
MRLPGTPLFIERVPGRPTVSINLHDLWVGVYWKYWHTLFASPHWTLDLYICPFPAVLVALRIQRGGAP